MSASPVTAPTLVRGGTGRVLLVDDEPEPLRATARILRHAGYEVVEADSGEAAASAIGREHFDVVVSDIAMPAMDGIALLQFMRAHDEDVPVVLVTGAPAVETAMDAVEHGAFKYLVKPVAPERLEDVVRAAIRLRRMAAIRREAMLLVAKGPDDALERQFVSALHSMWLAYQPIINKDGTLYGYEALLRSDEPHLPTPGHLLDAAERLGRLAELGRRVRARAPEPFENDGTSLFVNLHPRDLDDDELVSDESPLVRIANRVVLEITERSSIDSIHDLRVKIARLRAVGYRIAIDDLGAGYAGLTSFALLEPDIVKLDMALVRDVDKQPVKQRLIESMTVLCREMGILVVGEGVETRLERDTLMALGCDLFQGYALARPGRAFPRFEW